jgi:branched-chain amino acid transport system permease protein
MSWRRLRAETACLGGFLIGLFEGVWSAHLPIVHRDIMVDALLSVLLVVRPGGLFGTQEKTPRQV